MKMSVLVMALLLLLTLQPPAERAKAIGGVEVVLFFYEPVVYVNATPQDSRVATLTGYVAVSRSPTVIQDVEVSLEGSADGRPVTINPSVMVFTYEDEKKNFTLSFSVPDVLENPWESITVHAGGTWRLLLGLDSGEVRGANATVLPAPTAYVTAKLLKEKVTGEVGKTVEIPIFLENLGDTALQVALEVVNEEELQGSSIVVEYPRIPITVLAGQNMTVKVEAKKTSGMGGKYRIDIRLKPFTSFGGTPDNVRRVVVPGGFNITMTIRTTVGGVVRSPLVIVGVIVAVIGGAVGLALRRRAGWGSHRGRRDNP